MDRGEVERRQLKKQIRDHMATISKDFTRQELADELRVTKQAISSYLKGRTSPKAYVVRRLLARWPRSFTFRDADFGPEAFGAETDGPTKAVRKQGYLLDVLSKVKKENMRVEVEQGAGPDTELRVIIKIRA